MDFELDLSSENMTSFLELEQEIKEATTNLPEHLLRPSVIVKPRAKPAAQPSLTDIMTSCGIEYELPEDCNVSSPSSIHSDIQLDQNQELIEELEEFFIKTEGSATVVDESQHQEELSLTKLNNPLSSSLVTPDGQNVIIIIAPSSPTESVTTTASTSSDSDPEWTPSPAPLSPAQLSVLNTKPEQAKAADTSLRGSLPGRQEGEEEGPEQDGRLQVPQEEEERAGPGRGGAGGSGGQEQPAAEQAGGDGDRVQIPEEADGGGWTWQIHPGCQLLNHDTDRSEISLTKTREQLSGCWTK